MSQTNQSFSLLLAASIILVGCCKDDISKRHGEADVSFDSKWDYMDVVFYNESNGTVSIKLVHPNIGGLAEHLRFKNIDPAEGNVPLLYVREGSGLQEGRPTAYLDVVIDEDALGEIYVIDTSVTMISTLTLNCVSNNRISGEFEVNFVYSQLNGPIKFAEYIPDTFKLFNGKFDAARGD